VKEFFRENPCGRISEFLETVPYTEQVIWSHFGGANELKEREDIEEVRRNSIENSLEEFAENSEVFTWKEFNEATGIGKHIFEQLVGNWSERKKELVGQVRSGTPNCSGRDKKYHKEDIIEQIKEASKDSEGCLTSREFSEREETPTRSTINRLFGSWNEAKEKAGVE
jgi:hypothetical protein